MRYLGPSDLKREPSESVQRRSRSCAKSRTVCAPAETPPSGLFPFLATGSVPTVSTDKFNQKKNGQSILYICIAFSTWHPFAPRTAPSSIRRRLELREQPRTTIEVEEMDRLQNKTRNDVLLELAWQE
jgi:hypothetical protein